MPKMILSEEVTPPKGGVRTRLVLVYSQFVAYTNHKGGICPRKTAVWRRLIGRFIACQSIRHRRTDRQTSRQRESESSLGTGC